MYRRPKDRQLKFLIAIAKVLEEFKRHKTLTPAQLTDLIGCTYTTTLRYLGHLNCTGESRHIYVKEWIRNPSGRPTPVYTLGRHRNVQKPRVIHRRKAVKEMVEE